MNPVIKITVHKGSMEWSDQKVPCWQVDITRAVRDGFTTSMQTFVARTFAIPEPNVDLIELRRVRANQYAEQLSEIIGANAVSLA
jgi:hypothetical protein